ncbi:hypothetical protein LINPERHAP2_LOCUS3156, partial [Linum perenne]
PSPGRLQAVSRPSPGRRQAVSRPSPVRLQPVAQPFRLHSVVAALPSPARRRCRLSSMDNKFQICFMIPSSMIMVPFSFCFIIQ